MKYLEKSDVRLMGAVMVAAWDWLMTDVKEHHQTFFESGFDYEAIKNNKLPIKIINSTNDPWIDFEKSKMLASKISADFIAVSNAGHFMEADGYKEFPLLLQVIEENFNYG